MNHQPSWQWNEMEQVGVDLADPDKADAYRTSAHKLGFARRFPGIMEALRLSPDAALIDMGCGPGAFALYAAQRCGRVFAADVSSAMLDLARTDAAAAGVTNVEFHHAGLLTYEHQSEPADAAVCVTVLHHLPDFWKLAGLRRLARMLRPGARLYLFDVVFSFPPGETARAFGDMIRDLDKRVGPGLARDAETHLREEFSTYDWVMEGLLERAGFEIAKADYESEVTASYVCVRPE